MPDNQNSSDPESVAYLLDELRFTGRGWFTRRRREDMADRLEAAIAADFDRLRALWTAPAMLNGVEGLVAKWRTLADAGSPTANDYNAGQRWAYAVAAAELEAALRAADNRDAAGGDDSHAFKNFHRSLCARFGYTHDEVDWRRDQVSLEEHIANLITPTAAPAGEAVAFLGLDQSGSPIYASMSAPIALVATDTTHPPAAEVREKWIACANRLPTKLDADCNGEVVWRRSGEPVLGRIASGRPIDATHWHRTERSALSPPGRAEGE